jgi:hypothetical protein
MLDFGQDILLRAAREAMLGGRPCESLVDFYQRQAAEEHAAKLVDFAAMRRKLRPDDVE